MTNVDNEEETKLLQSEIWTTLFRGGYMTGKLQRSLSGYHVSDVCLFVFLSKSHFLNAIVNFESLIGQPDGLLSFSDIGFE